MTATEEIARELTLVEGMIARARAEVSGGGVIDLQPLEQHVVQLCARIAGLPAGQGQRFKPGLVALLDDLAGFGGQLEAGLEALQRELGRHGARRSAVSAYAKPSS